MTFGLSAGALAATAMAGGAVVGGMISADASKSAANTQANAANQATQAQKDMFGTTVGLEAPFRSAGVDATNKLSYLLGTSPTGYSNPAGGATASGATGNQFAPSTGALAVQGGGAAVGPAPGGGAETADQIRARLTPQFTQQMSFADQVHALQSGSTAPGVDTAGLDAAVQAELAKQGGGAGQTQQLPATVAGAQPGTATPGTPAASDPAYGSLLHNFGTADFQLDPGIQFQTQQGNLALRNSQAAKDGVLSGSALKDLIGYNQGMAGLGYQSAYDRYMANKSFTLGSLMDLSKQGQAAAGNTVSSAPGFSSGIASTITGAGNAQASGIVGSANALSGGITGASNAYLLRNMLGGGGTPAASGGGAAMDPSMFAG